MTSRLPILAVLVGMVVGGCGHVDAQNDKTVTISGNTTASGIFWVAVPCPKGQHYLPGAGMMCVYDDGKPPQWVSGATREVPCPTESGTYFGTGVTCTQPGPDHWECEKGYVLDGAKITWPDGVARIEPERCKAEAK